METESGICEVCKSEAKHRCTGCKIKFYCGAAHQRDDWPQHKLTCRPWEINESPELGKHLIATRDLNPGDLVIAETPLVWGPARHIERVCVGCGDPNVRVRCPGCSWYACKVSCDGLVDDNRHAVECKVLEGLRLIPSYDFLMVLRMILIYKRSPGRWQTLDSLESHQADRGRDTEAYEETETMIEQLEPIIEALAVDKEVVRKICGLIDVNALETNPPEGSVAIYQYACLLEHSCLANTRHNFTVDYKGRPRIIVTAATLIKKGQHISTTYTHVLWSTRARREHLLATKYFACHCERCKDPTELKSHMSTLKCTCGSGLVLPKDPLDLDTEWSCNSCPGTLTSAEVLQLTDRLGEEVENAMTTAKESVLSDLLSRLQVLLHPGHQHCIAVAHSLIQLQSPDNPQKRELCVRILETTSILDPYGTRLCLYTAVALRELAGCPGEDRQLNLERAIELLKHEPAQSPGEKFRKLIETEL
ncbi:SET domain-containing protein SmydA-8-like [Microplitis mediator]|uniref:SET domain-containing protein SmydA-8-like n=1 Tax=Microplitis mediator TaxID=375433 RepID=UPI002556A1A0|nr:SET domain-containing protein SmydA-8-like [Microplitis mediator]